MNWLTEKTWEEFQDVGLLWWINRVLHLFGWAIVFEKEEDGTIGRVYPAHCKFRGFAGEGEDEGFRKLTNHMQSDIKRMVSDLDLKAE